MGRYFNPINDLKYCNIIEGEDYIELKKKLKDKEVLVGLFDRVKFKNAPLIDSQEEFNTFWEQYKIGVLVSYQFYAVPYELAKKNINNFI